MPIFPPEALRIYEAAILKALRERASFEGLLPPVEGPLPEERINYRERARQEHRRWGQEKIRQFNEKSARELMKNGGNTMAQCDHAPITVVPAPGIGKCLVVNEDWSVRIEPVDEQTQAVTDAQQYIKDYEQWIKDHPGKIPTQEMMDRYAQEQLLVANVRR